MRRRSRSTWGAVVLAVSAALGAAGCATRSAPAPARAAAGSAEQPPAGPGDVLVRNERLLVYLPRADDTLRSIAARFLGSAEQDWLIAEHNTLLDPDFRGPVVGEPLVVPLGAFNPLGVHTDRYQTVTVLCYHRFGAGHGKMSMPPEHFAAQLDWLAANGYRVVRLADLQAFLDGRGALPARSVVITIDDGYASVSKLALGPLQAHGDPATLFVYTDFVGAPDALGWPQLQALAASGLVDIQAHSKTHRNLVARQPGESDGGYRQHLDREMREPRAVLESRLPDTRVEQYAYPYGDANATVLEALQRNRYRLAVTVEPGSNAFFTSPLLLHRTMIYGDMDLAAFARKLQTSSPVEAP